VQLKRKDSLVILKQAMKILILQAALKLILQASNRDSTSLVILQQQIFKNSIL